jgi:hypothetical protein
MDDQIKPVAWKCVWIADGDGCDWEQYHDEDDPMPERWDDAPDEITPLYSQQAIDSLRAEVERLSALVGAVERCKGYRECGRCKGRGTIGIRDICPPCGGTGRVS